MIPAHDSRKGWVETVRGFGRLFKQEAVRLSQRWLQGEAAAQTAFCRPLARRQAVDVQLDSAVGRSE
jgi:hypothetical protein